MLSRKMQSGRSMIEMLGVLGIMAVITVLGISAYTMATRNVKSNNIKAEVATIAQQIRTMTQPDEYGLWGTSKSYTNSFVDTGLMKIYNGMGVGTSATPGYTITGTDNVSFVITVELADVEDCSLVAAMDWSNADAVASTCTSANADVVITYNK